jgi:hypothetical protein
MSGIGGRITVIVLAALLSDVCLDFASTTAMIDARWRRKAEGLALHLPDVLGRRM